MPDYSTTNVLNIVLTSNVLLNTYSDFGFDLIHSVKTLKYRWKLVSVPGTVLSIENNY